jgi:hypothetical protein
VNEGRRTPWVSSARRRAVGSSSAGWSRFDGMTAALPGVARWSPPAQHGRRFPQGRRGFPGRRIGCHKRPHSDRGRLTRSGRAGVHRRPPAGRASLRATTRPGTGQMLSRPRTHPTDAAYRTGDRGAVKAGCVVVAPAAARSFWLVNRHQPASANQRPSQRTHPASQRDTRAPRPAPPTTSAGPRPRRCPRARWSTVGDGLTPLLGTRQDGSKWPRSGRRRNQLPVTGSQS